MRPISDNWSCVGLGHIFNRSRGVESCHEPAPIARLVGFVLVTRRGHENARSTSASRELESRTSLCAPAAIPRTLCLEFDATLSRSIWRLTRQKEANGCSAQASTQPLGSSNVSFGVAGSAGLLVHANNSRFCRFHATAGARRSITLSSPTSLRRLTNERGPQQ